MSAVTWSRADPRGFLFLTSTEQPVSNFPLSPAAPVSFKWKNMKNICLHVCVKGNT